LSHFQTLRKTSYCESKLNDENYCRQLLGNALCKIACDREGLTLNQLMNATLVVNDKEFQLTRSASGMDTMTIKLQNIFNRKYPIAVEDATDHLARHWVDANFCGHIIKKDCST